MKKSQMFKASKYPQCPRCQNSEFEVIGYVLYGTNYDASPQGFGGDNWDPAGAKVDWDIDRITQVNCRNCGMDLRKMFQAIMPVYLAPQLLTSKLAGISEWSGKMYVQECIDALESWEKAIRKVLPGRQLPGTVRVLLEDLREGITISIDKLKRAVD